jgi:hypothetical protein
MTKLKQTQAALQRVIDAGLITNPTPMTVHLFSDPGLWLVPENDLIHVVAVNNHDSRQQCIQHVTGPIRAFMKDMAAMPAQAHNRTTNNIIVSNDAGKAVDRFVKFFCSQSDKHGFPVGVFEVPQSTAEIIKELHERMDTGSAEPIIFN